ncbi:Kynurenine formamidase [Peptoclostridium litorale DSM 5388]|uniref:Kynurenine formamidase n=1 Tax=Peptoclostridium litorale DSM 5388 TaxID=1121324 RepID=A0A069R9Q0_PEPLI|nr:cyclase family protein [Peptoclostridium litorale]KDR93794.1 kynurenine formamidase KynB [Peptoclostridium litorale DSM 5388]SIN85986.1 Kynurenine formamidase [Peptoclostridium litorale DSM 5388]
MKKGNVYDISMRIGEYMSVYKNRDENRPEIETVRSFEDSSAHESKIHMNLHTGTHIDMPLHIIKGGASSDELDITRLMGSCRVIDMTGAKDSITREMIEGEGVKEGEFLLLKTRNSFSEKFNPEFVYLDKEAAILIAKRGVRGVGIDSLGIERGQAGHPTHRALLENGIVIMEGLRLRDVPAGEYVLIALPLRIEGVEALPVRAVLIDKNTAADFVESFINV